MTAATTLGQCPGTIEPLALRPEDAARALGISRSQVYVLMKSGGLPAVKAGHITLVRTDTLRTYLDRLPSAQAE